MINLTSQERQGIYSFLNGAIDLWCRIYPKEKFKFHTVAGNKKSDYWKNTELQVLYDKYYTAYNKSNPRNISHDKAYRQAGRFGGKLLSQHIKNLNNPHIKYGSSSSGWTKVYWKI